MKNTLQHSEHFIALPHEKVHIILNNGVALDISFDSFVVVEVSKDIPSILFHSIKRFENGYRRDE